MVRMCYRLLGGGSLPEARPRAQDSRSALGQAGPFLLDLLPPAQTFLLHALGILVAVFQLGPYLLWNPALRGMAFAIFDHPDFILAKLSYQLAASSGGGACRSLAALIICAAVFPRLHGTARIPSWHWSGGPRLRRASRAALEHVPATAPRRWPETNRGLRVHRRTAGSFLLNGLTLHRWKRRSAARAADRARRRKCALREALTAWAVTTPGECRIKRADSSKLFLRQEIQWSPALPNQARNIETLFYDLRSLTTRGIWATARRWVQAGGK